MNAAVALSAQTAVASPLTRVQPRKMTATLVLPLVSRAQRRELITAPATWATQVMASQFVKR